MSDATDLYAGAHAAFYDAFHGGYVADHAYYVRTAKRSQGPVLEIACGTGRLGMALIAAGVDYRGMDASESMLERFRAKAAASGRAAPKLSRGDMRSFEFQEKFGLIAITFNSLQHIHRDEDVFRVFDCCRKHLKPGAQFVFDVFNPDRKILERDPEKWHPVSRFLDEEKDDWCDVMETYCYDAASKISRIRWRYRYEKGGEGTIGLEMRQFFPQEMDALVESSGFRIRKKWGDFTGSGFSAVSPRQVFECEASNE